MPIMINRGKEMLRICPNDSKKIEYSTNQGLFYSSNEGRNWILRKR